jgi:hypothetical protein
VVAGVNLRQVAPVAGVGACLALLAAAAAPYALIADAGTGLSVYYRAGPVGAGAVAFLAVLQVVVFAAGTRGSADPATAAGVAVVVGAAMAGLGALWALSVPVDVVLGFPAPWMGWHRHALVALAVAVAAASAGYARAVV